MTLDFDIKAWYHQVTTGAGFTTFLGTITAYLTGNLTLSQSVPLFVGAAVAIVWPEKPAASQQAEKVAGDIAKDAPAIASDISALLSVFKEGMSHQAKLSAQANEPKST